MLGYRDNDIIIISIVSILGSVSVSSLGYFSSVGSSSKPYHYSSPLSLRAHHIKEYFKKNRGKKRKFIQTHK